jgi:hypothetical protein
MTGSRKLKPQLSLKLQQVSVLVIVFSKAEFYFGVLQTKRDKNQPIRTANKKVYFSWRKHCFLALFYWLIRFSFRQ